MFTLFWVCFEFVLRLDFDYKTFFWPCYDFVLFFNDLFFTCFWIPYSYFYFVCEQHVFWNALPFRLLPVYYFFVWKMQQKICVEGLNLPGNGIFKSGRKPQTLQTLSPEYSGWQACFQYTSRTPTSVTQVAKFYAIFHEFNGADNLLVKKPEWQAFKNFYKKKIGRMKPNHFIGTLKILLWNSWIGKNFLFWLCLTK